MRHGSKFFSDGNSNVFETKISGVCEENWYLLNVFLHTIPNCSVLMSQYCLKFQEQERYSSSMQCQLWQDTLLGSQALAHV